MGDIFGGAAATTWERRCLLSRNRCNDPGRAVSLSIEVQLNRSGNAMKKHLAVLMARLAVLLFAATASAQGYVFDGNLAPGNETPPLDTGMGGLCVATVVGLDAGGSQALIVMSTFGHDTRITSPPITTVPPDGE